MGTDFKSYSVVWGCSNLINIANIKVLWLMTRDRIPTNSIAVDTALAVIKSNGLNNIPLRLMDQSNCFWYMFFFTTRILSLQLGSIGRQLRKGIKKVPNIKNYHATSFAKNLRNYPKTRIQRPKNRHLALFKSKISLSRHQSCYELIRAR